MPSGQASASNAVRQEMLSSKSSVSARVCHQREAVDEDVEEDNTELNELARERAGEPDPSEVMELERERETTVRSSPDALALVKLEQTEVSSSATREQRASCCEIAVAARGKALATRLRSSQQSSCQILEPVCETPPVAPPTAATGPLR